MAELGTNIRENNSEAADEVLVTSPLRLALERTHVEMGMDEWQQLA